LGLTALPNVRVEDAAAVATAIRLYSGGLDFADSLHVASSASSEAFVTYDAKLTRRARQAGLAQSAHCELAANLDKILTCASDS
jgi:hypothetical protein